MKSSPNSKDKHIDSIDWMKGLCIICITMLHIENGLLPMWANYFISIFMITGFYVTNGWIHGLKQTESVDVKQFAGKRLRSLGIPYLWFTFIILMVDIIFYFVGHYNIDVIARDVYKSIVLRGIGTLWFLPVLFFWGIIIHYIQKQATITIGVVNRYFYSYLCIYIDTSTRFENCRSITFYNKNATTGRPKLCYRIGRNNSHLLCITPVY